MTASFSPSSPATPRRAATLVLLRDGAKGMEVLLLRRVARANDRSSGAHVFPGGTLDAADAACHGCVAGLDDAAASAQLGIERGGLDYHVAALRECFEEAGVLVVSEPAAGAAWLEAGTAVELRRQLRRGEIGVGALCDALGVRLAADRLVYFSHWVTPAGLPKRFDTRFFIADMPAGQSVVHDDEETQAHCWIRPVDALAADSGLVLPTPTRKTLEAIAGFASVADCLAHARAPRAIPRIQPALAGGANGLQPVPPDHPAYAEVMRIDPHGTGLARYAIEPGHCVVLSPRVRRVTARNPGLMTGPGTNTWLVGDPSRNEWAVIDPGPADAAHVEAIVAAAPGPIRWVLVTHTHRDHSPGARPLAARTGASCLGMAARHDSGQDTDFAPERTLAHGELVPLGPGTTLRVLHTPGHASNHLCYLLVEERTLFTGDHVMQGSTVVINPPDGDMAAYMASLQALLDEDLGWLAPGHGFLIGDPASAIRRLIHHRMAREAKVRQALLQGGRTLDELLPRVYDDVPAALHPVARRSLLAHLVKLRAEGLDAATDVQDMGSGSADSRFGS